MLRFVAHVGTDVSEQSSSSIVRAIRIDEFVTLMMEGLGFFQMSVVTRATWRNIPEYGILHSHPPENLKSYIALTGWTV
jgi:hypothetical protein